MLFALSMPAQNVVMVGADDTDVEIMRKATAVVPTELQLTALRQGFIAFVHYGPNTYTKREWGDGLEDEKVFAPTTIDTDQWCRALKAAGVKMVIFTAKHHDGYVLWQSRYTRHGIMSSDYMDGKGDVMRLLSESCRRYGLKLGIYLSPADLYQMENAEGLYGNLSRETLRTIPREVAGRPFMSDKRFTFEVDDYNEYYLNQLYELLTEYGEISEVWLDGAHPKRKGGQQYNYTAWRQLIRELAPNTTIFGREDLRWCGNEAGDTRESEWNVIPYDDDPSTMTVFPDMLGDLGSDEQLLSHSRPYYLHYQPAETDTSIRDGWFYRDEVSQSTRTVDDLFDIYERTVGGNSIFLLNVPPTQEGTFAARDVEVLRETGELINKVYATNLLTDANGDANLLDNDEDSYVMLDSGDSVEITLSRPTTINRIMLQEAVKSHSERVERHAIDAYINGEWVELAQATNIGYKRILRFPTVTTDRLRLRIISARATAAIASISAHYRP
jgi:alpha-L-fucosidase